MLCPFRLPAAWEAHLLLIQSICFLIKFEGDDLHNYMGINLSTPGQYEMTKEKPETKPDEARKYFSPFF